mgnify:CR=1 FL=1|tara:strand:- start:7138 stop:7713 length:576 start_codon:yes stop_codon:yes gene_type:complete
MQTTPLSQLLESIRAGHQFRSRIDPEPEGEYRIVQGKDINRSRKIVVDELTRVEQRHIKDPERNCLRPGEVLFMARGTRLMATVVDETIPPQTVAVSSFHVLVPNTDLLLPEYLVWAINDETAQSWLVSNISGTTIPMITQKTLLSLPLPTPSIQSQHRFVQLLRLAEKERELAEQLYKTRQQMLRGILQS